MKIVKQSAHLINAIDYGMMLKTWEHMARVAYQSFDKVAPGSDLKLLKHCITRKHESTLEHYSFSFDIVTDRGISHELVRHRLASYTQESTRFCCYKDEICVIQPPNLNADELIIWRGAITIAEQCYRQLLAGGVKPQIARSVLPTCLKTELIMTANIREWRHIIRLRTAPDAHPQIRELMLIISNILFKSYPAFFEDIV